MKIIVFEKNICLLSGYWKENKNLKLIFLLVKSAMRKRIVEDNFYINIHELLNISISADKIGDWFIMNHIY